MTTPDGDTIRSAVTRDFYRPGLVNGISTTFNGTVVDSPPYTYDALSRPTSRNSDVFAYNDRSEVISAQIGTNLFAHAYDSIGNQTNHVANAATNTNASAHQPTSFQLSGGKSFFGSISMSPVTGSRAAGGVK